MKRIIRILVLATLLNVVFVCYTFADTINIPADYSTIQAGINASTNGDTVLVQPGTYVENINYNGKNITVGSLFLTTADTSYISQTIIDGNQNGSVVTFESGEDSTAVLTGFTITNGNSSEGGGICCDHSSPSISNVTITDNTANWRGGGIVCYSNSSPIFNEDNRCNVYLNNVNNRGCGSDIYLFGTQMTVIVDTFTVLNPTDFHASLIENFTFDILHGIQNQVNADLYVSPDGDNNNSGLTADDPLKTIQYAFSIILADSLNPHTIYLSDGIYSPSMNGEFFPINMINYVSLIGESEDGVILDAEGVANVMIFNNTVESSIEELTVTGGHATRGGGVYCINSNPIISTVTISGNIADYDGGGIFCNDSSPSLVNSILWNDSPQEVYFSEHGDPNTITISYSDFEGGEAGIVTNNNATVNWLDGNIDVDPLFVDPLSGDYHLSWANYPIPDSTKSPCIDAGDPSSPPDPDGTIADMGAYYFNQNVSVDDPPEIITAQLVICPNPICVNNNNLTISFSIHKQSKVKIQLFNIKGQLVSTLINEDKNIGEYSIDYQVNEFSSGIYFTRLSVDGVDRVIKKVVLLR